MTKKITPKQVDRIADLGRESVKTAVVGIGPSSSEAQDLVISKGGEFKARVKVATEKILEEMFTPQKYQNEYKPTDASYSKRHSVVNIHEQLQVLGGLLDLDCDPGFKNSENICKNLPPGAEGWFAIPKASALAREHFPALTDPYEQYCEAIRFVLDILKGRKLKTDYKEMLDLGFEIGNIRPDPYVWEIIKGIEANQKGDMVVIPSQLGLRHRGKSPRRAKETFLPNEFGLGALAMGSIMLTHRSLISSSKVLNACCLGDYFEVGNQEEAKEQNYRYSPSFQYHGPDGKNLLFTWEATDYYDYGDPDLDEVIATPTGFYKI
jgi:hypothetical protein